MTTDPKPVARGITSLSIRQREALTLIRQVRNGVSELSGPERLNTALHILRRSGSTFRKTPADGPRGPVTRVTVSQTAEEVTHHHVLALSDNDIDETLHAVQQAPYRKSVDYDFAEDS